MTPALARVNAELLPGLVVCPTNKARSVWAFLPAGSFNGNFYRLEKERFYVLEDQEQLARSTNDAMKMWAEQVRTNIEGKQQRLADRKERRAMFGF